MVVGDLRQRDLKGHEFSEPGCFRGLLVLQSSESHSKDPQGEWNTFFSNS